MVSTEAGVLSYWLILERVPRVRLHFERTEMSYVWLGHCAQT